MPRQLQPDGIRLDYFNAIVPHIRRFTRQYHDAQIEIIRLLQAERAARQDGPPVAEPKHRATVILEDIASRATNSLDPRALHAEAEVYGKMTGRFQWAQLDRQVRSATGVSLGAVERPIRDLIPTFAKANVELIQSVPVRYQDRIAKDVREAFEKGTHPEVLAQRFIELDGMAERDARRIAKDQIGKLFGQFNQERQEAMGVTGYTWISMDDSHVRDEHVPRHGQHFEWDDPPEDGHPGEPVECRCWAQPDFSTIQREL